MLIQELNLQHLDSLSEDQLLFGPDGLGLDSLDGLQIAQMLEDDYGVDVPQEAEDAAPILKNLGTIVDFILANRKEG